MFIMRIPIQSDGVFLVLLSPAYSIRTTSYSSDRPCGTGGRTRTNDSIRLPVYAIHSKENRGWTSLVLSRDTTSTEPLHPRAACILLPDAVVLQYVSKRHVLWQGRDGRGRLNCSDSGAVCTHTRTGKRSLQLRHIASQIISTNGFNSTSSG